MEAAAAIAELIWLACQAVVGLVWMCTDRRGLAVVGAAALWLWLVDSSAVSWIVVPGIVLIAGIWIQSRRSAERKKAEAAAGHAELERAHESAYESANMPGGEPSSGGPA